MGCEPITYWDGITAGNRLLFSNGISCEFNSLDALVETLVRMLEMRDVETEEHTRRVAALSVDMARLCGLSMHEQIYIKQGALLHDIGKVGIPDKILRKKGPLSTKEFGIIKRHPSYVEKLLGHIPLLRPAVDISYSHHERWDGSGYPRGLKNIEIPLLARVFAIADVWDALISNRPYRPAWSEDAAFDYIHHNSGILFDPEIVDIFLNSTGLIELPSLHE